MLNLFKKKTKPSGEVITFKILDMHCTSCALNIDGALEETTGVIEANTSYAQAKTSITYDAGVIKPVQLQKIIGEQGYKVEVLSS